MAARMLAPLHNAPAGKRREDWTREEREAALLLAPPDCSRLTAAERDAAGAAVCAFEAMLAPAGPELVIEWLLPFGLAVRNAQGRQETAFRAAAIAAVLPPIPAACFAAQTRPLLWTEFFPSAEDVRRALEPIAAGWRATAAALRSLAAFPAFGALDLPAPAAGDEWAPVEVERRVAELERGPRDHWARRRAAFLESTMRAERPDLLPAVGCRLAALQAMATSSRPAVAGTPDEGAPRPKAAHLAPAALAVIRARDPLVQGAVAARAEASERGSGEVPAGVGK